MYPPKVRIFMQKIPLQMTFERQKAKKQAKINVTENQQEV